jgi:hypothetical protein
MNIAKAVENIGTLTELKRVASAYVIDYRNLTDEEIKQALIKTAPQYYFPANLEKTLREAFFNENRDVGAISSLILKLVLLHKDEFMCPKRELEDEIISWEQSIVDRSNEDFFKKGGAKGKSVELLSFVVETAWGSNNQISVDEKNLIEKLRERLKISESEYSIIEAKLGKFPKPGNQVHTRGEIDDARRFLQFKGVLFSIRDGEGVDFDVIPEEIAMALRKLLGLELRRHGYQELARSKFVRSKAHLTETLTKCGIEVEGQPTVDELQAMVMEQIKPSVLLGGLSPKDGLPMEVLSRWCDELGLNVSGLKAERIERIIGYYDKLLEKSDSVDDAREVWYQYFAEFAGRKLEFLRGQQLIDKDLDVEHRFEEATNYLFEKKFLHKPLTQVGSNHPDGVLSYRDELIQWDNKSKETPVNLKDHLKQFDGYVRSAEKKVACFLVIAPDFTAESSLLAMQYRVENGTTITLITAEELKLLAEKWAVKLAQSGSQDPFPLGYLIQPGRFNVALVAGI